MSRVLAVLTVVALACQLTFTSGTVVVVCRYTGEVLDRCCCKKVVPESTRDASSHLAKACCCDFLHRAAIAQAAIVERSADNTHEHLVPAVLAMPVAGRDGPDSTFIVLAERSLGPPPSVPRYIAARALLI